jgi:hypothetical protein
MPAVGLNVTEHDPPDSTHVFELNVPMVEGLPERVTVPVGVDVVPPSVSVTVTVQVETALLGIREGTQLTAVDVLRKTICPSNGRNCE